MTSSQIIREPTQCIYWRHPERVHGIATRLFAVLATYWEDEDCRRGLFRCHECGQLYVYEFLEIVDYATGNDPQYRTYVPISSEAEGAKLARRTSTELSLCAPALHVNWPAAAKAPNVYWARRIDQADTSNSRPI